MLLYIKDLNVILHAPLGIIRIQHSIPMIYVIIAIQIVKNAQLHLTVNVLHAMEVFFLMDLHVIAHVQTKIHMETQLIILAKLAIHHVKPVMEEH